MGSDCFLAFVLNSVPSKVMHKVKHDPSDEIDSQLFQAQTVNLGKDVQWKQVAFYIYFSDQKTT